MSNLTFGAYSLFRASASLPLSPTPTFSPLLPCLFLPPPFLTTVLSHPRSNSRHRSHLPPSLPSLPYPPMTAYLSTSKAGQGSDLDSTNRWNTCQGISAYTLHCGSVDLIFILLLFRHPCLPHRFSQGVAGRVSITPLRTSFRMLLFNFSFHPTPAYHSPRMATTYNYISQPPSYHTYQSPRII